MKGFVIYLSSILMLSGCVDKTPSNPSFNRFEETFEYLELMDTVDSEKKGWARGRSYEVESPVLEEVLFYEIVDTSKLTYKRWDERLYAEGKIKLDKNRTGFFVSRQLEDITYDRTTLLLIFNKTVLEQEITFSEFVGYESAINEIQSKLFKNEQGDWAMIRKIYQSYYDYEKEENLESSEIEQFILKKK